jgi:hypothetical protein
MSGYTATIWCSECAGGQQRPIAYVTHGFRGYWLMKRNFSYTQRKMSFTMNLSRAWARPQAHGTTCQLRCVAHGERTLNLAELEQTIRHRKSATHPAKLSV